MADAYLNVAEHVLLSSRRPLRPGDIIRHAYAGGLLPWHLHGARQDKTLHARISEDVARNPEGSRFFRTGPGIFFLREMVKDPNIPDAYKQFYFAPPRRKELRRDNILTFLGIAGRTRAAKSQLISMPTLRQELERGRYAYLSYSDALVRPETAIAYSFVLVFNERQVLSFRCGKFRPSTDPLYGMRSVGLGGAVYAEDRDFLFQSLFGIIASGINELGYGIGLPRQLSERARYGNEVRPHVGVLLKRRKGRPAILQIVMGYQCAPEFLPSKGALSVNDLRWIDVENPANSLDDFDETSRLLFQSGEVAKLRARMARHVRR